MNSSTFCFIFSLNTYPANISSDTVSTSIYIFVFAKTKRLILTDKSYFNYISAAIKLYVLAIKDCFKNGDYSKKKFTR